MTFLIFATVGGLTLVGLVMLAIGITKAPEAFEDDKGFHSGPEQDAAKLAPPTTTDLDKVRRA